MPGSKNILRFRSQDLVAGAMSEVALGDVYLCGERVSVRPGLVWTARRLIKGAA